MYHLIGVLHGNHGSISCNGTLPKLVNEARRLESRYRGGIDLQLYRFDGTNVADCARPVPLP